ncbi:MAG: hypothetical protein ACRYFS_13355 [Janthinobacterium lividum]
MSRVIAALLAMLLAAGWPGVLVIGSITAVHSTPMNAIGWLCFGFLEIMSLGFAALFLYGSGPEHLTLDLNLHTYRYVFGWPLAPQVQEGLWDDMAGIYVWNMTSGRLSGYGVGIAWKGNKMRSCLLGMRSTLLGKFDGLGRLDRANSLAEEMSSLLGVPLVEPPFPVRRRA